MEDHDSRLRCTWRSGPDCAGERPLAPGRYVVGRAAQADVRCDDPALEPHHALLDVDADGVVSVLQLSGRRPMPARVGGVVELGGSVLRCAPAAASAPPAHIVDGALHREPRLRALWEEPTFTEPEPPTRGSGSHGALLPALLALAGTATLAVLLRQVMFVVFGAMGAFVAVGAWAAQRIGGRRERRGARRRHVTEVEALGAALEVACGGFLAFHRAAVGSVAHAATTIDQLSGDLWSRRAADGDAFLVSLGTGEVVWQPQGLDGTRARVLADEQVALDLGPGTRLAVRGRWPAVAGVVRALIVQLAATCGPADVHLVVVTAEPDRWRWLDGLPHACGSSGATLVGGESELTAMVDELEGDGPGHVLVITDQVDLLATRTHPLRRLVMSDRAPALLAVVPADAAVPHVCSSQLHVTSTGDVPAGRWIPGAGAGLPHVVRTAGLSERSAARLVARLRPLRDPDDPLTAAASVPADVDLAELLTEHDPGALTSTAIAANWLAGDNDPSPRTVLGRAADGVVDIDLVRDGPHALLAGTTGAGKSELLRSLVVGLACGSSPDHLTFVLVDYKGGATFDGCTALPHVVGMVTDLDGPLADRALRSLQAELRHREERLREWSAPDLATFRERAPHEVLPRLVVIIDEFAALVAEQPQFIEALVGVAQRGRSLGVHLILATQRPQGVITEQIRANTNLRIALRLQDTADSMDVLGCAAAAQIPRRRPGRAVVRLGPDEVVEFQTARVTDEAGAVAAVVGAWEMVGGSAPRRPWQPPLPDVLVHAPGRLGLLDDPDRQAIEPLTWTPSDGNLLIVGAGGSGVTTALLAAGMAALDECNVHLYVIDAAGGAALGELAVARRCAAVVGAHESERVGRVLSRLAKFSEAHASGQSDGSHPVLLIDGFTVLRQQLDELDTAEQHATLERLVSGAPGITVVLAADRPSAVPPAVLAQFAARWVLHLHDAHDASLLGVNPVSVAAPGLPGRLVIAPAGHVAQLALPPPVSAGFGAPAPAVETLPAALAVAGLPPSTATAGTTALSLGARFGDGLPAVLRLHDGEHVLVVGPARSGRTSALVRIAMAWSDAHPEGITIAARSRRSPAVRADHLADGTGELLEAIAGRPAGAHVLVVIDDAELVEDSDGRLGALAASNAPGLTIVAAGRPDALRQSYGHWTTVVRRSRLGLVMAASSDLDGDLLGAALPRRLPVAARPGLAWIVGDEGPVLAQLAIDEGEPPIAGGGLS